MADTEPVLSLIECGQTIQLIGSRAVCQEAAQINRAIADFEPAPSIDGFVAAARQDLGVPRVRSGSGGAPGKRQSLM
jgi:hypothetical protein